MKNKKTLIDYFREMRTQNKQTAELVNNVPPKEENLQSIDDIVTLKTVSTEETQSE
jgi:hypothetical protein